MKNLFAVHKTDRKEATTFDENPYLVTRVSDEVKYRLEHAFDDAKDEDPSAKREPTAEEAALKRRSRILWGIGLVSLVGALVLFFLQGEEGNTVMTVIEFLLLIVSVVTTFMAKRANQKLMSAEQTDLRADFAVITDRLNEAAEEAAKELGVPKGAVSLEILPHHYKLVGDKLVTVGKKNRFDNIMVSAWTHDGALFLASAQELFRIPLSDIRDPRHIDEDFEVDFWLQEEEADSDKFKDDHIRPAGLMGKKCRGYYAVPIGEDYEFFVPGYDRDGLEELGIRK